MKAIQIFSNQNVVYADRAIEYETRLTEDLVLSAYRKGYYFPVKPDVTLASHSDLIGGTRIHIEVRAVGIKMQENNS